MRVRDLLEGTRKKEFDYEEVPVKTKKGEPASNQIDKVILKLEGSNSASFTILAKNYKELKVQVNDLTEQLDAKRDALREKMEEIFDDKDDLTTRIVETCSLTLQLAKAVQPSTSETVDYKKAYAELLAQLKDMVPDLADQVENLSEAAKKAATVVKAVDGKKSAFTVKEGVMDKAVSFFKKVHARFTSWLTRYDSKLDRASKLALKLK